MLQLFLILQVFSSNVFDSIHKWKQWQLPVKHQVQYIIVNPNTLQVYEIRDGVFTSVCERSTEFGNYNKGAFYFYYKDTLYAYGGFSQYRNHGLLNYFDVPTCSWENILDATLPPSMYPDIVYYDSLESQLYILAPRRVNKLTNTYERIPKLFAFDMESHILNDVGEVNEKLLEYLDFDWIRIAMPQGFVHLSNFEKNITVQLHFKDNKTIVGRFREFENVFSAMHKLCFLQYHKNTQGGVNLTTVYAYDTLLNSLVYRDLKIGNDLIRKFQTKEYFPIYYSWKRLVLKIFIFVLILGLLIYVILKYKPQSILTESEKGLLDFMLLGGSITTAQINTLLALDHLNVDSQNVKRAESIKALKSFLSAKYKIGAAEVIIEEKDPVDNRYKLLKLNGIIIQKAKRRLWQ